MTRPLPPDLSAHARLTDDSDDPPVAFDVLYSDDIGRGAGVSGLGRWRDEDLEEQEAAAALAEPRWGGAR